MMFNSFIKNLNEIQDDDDDDDDGDSGEKKLKFLQKVNESLRIFFSFFSSHFPSPFLDRLVIKLLMN